jgi:glutamate synthase (NADPH/NADH) small chain
MEGAVSIGAIERFVGDYMLENEEEALAKDKIGKKVAIIGSGPSGLSCAGLLAKNGVEVTVYEAFHRVGGVLTYGIPEFRLPKKLVEAEAGKLNDLGVKFELNTVVGKTVTLGEILEEFDAAFIGSGAGLPQFMGIKGENLNGVYSANEYLTRINLMGAYDNLSVTPVQKGDKVVVIGAGNVAMDAARTAKRMGASEVTVVYRRGREEMPARKAEIHHAEEEGINFNLLTNPVEYQGENGWVKKLKCVKMELTEPDASGRRKPIAIEGSEFEIETDMVIVALGTSPNPLLRESCANLKTEGKGILVVDENMMTSVDRVYAGGDAVTGAATVILAMGAGKKAAEAILKRFQA